MAKKMTRAALFFMIGTVILTAFYEKTAYGPVLSLAITFGTASYHLVMRLRGGMRISGSDAESCGSPQAVVPGRQAGNGGL